MIKKSLLLLLLMAICVSVFAQTPQEEYESWKRQAMGGYGQYRRQAIADYQAFRKKANEEYAEFVKAAWARVRPQPPQTAPEEPKPVQPPVAPKEQPKPKVVPHEEVAPTPEPKPVPDVPIVEPDVQEGKTIAIQYYGTTVRVREGGTFSLKSSNPDDLAKAWEQLSDGSFDGLLADCLKAKQRLSLSDWGYLLLVQQAAGKLLTGNGATLLEHWLLAQSGYSSRMAVSGKGALQVWVPFDVLVFDHPYIVLDSTVFFLVTENETGDDELQVMDHAFPGENIACLRMKQQPKLEQRSCKQRRLTSKIHPAMSLQVTVNKNLIDYYNAYPKVVGSWDVYANASLSEEVKRQIYPRLREMMDGLDEREKTTVLLGWVQTAFEYKTDVEQFGGERSLFADESLYYPYCDCEDRSILLSILVRDLIGLDVVLLQFPGHLATAVKFNSKVDGDWLDLEDGRYIVCDPTYIGAPVGMAMPECKEQGVNVIMLN